VQEASEYFHIGYKKLRKIIDEHPDAEIKDDQSFIRLSPWQMPRSFKRFVRVFSTRRLLPLHKGARRSSLGPSPLSR